LPVLVTPEIAGSLEYGAPNSVKVVAGYYDLRTGVVRLLD
jgi:hypothetical protein